MKKTPKLEDFIKNYVKNQRITETKEGYASWIKKNAPDAVGRYSTAVQAADTQRRKSLSTYGSTAEDLSSRGLSDSGYADYIDSTAEKQFNKTLSEQKADLIINDANGKHAYENYLKEIEKNRQKSYDAALSKLRNSGIMNYDEAYGAAIALGLSSEDAKSAAEKSTQEIISAARLKVIGAIVNKRLTSQQTQKYADSLGLNDEISKELAEIAYEINESVKNHKYSESYLDYLKEQAQKYDAE